MDKRNTKRPVSTNMSSGREFLSHYAKHEKLALSLAVLAGICSTGLMLAQWVSFSFFSERVIVHHEAITTHWIWLAFLLMSNVGRVFLTRLQSVFSQRASLRIRQSIRQKMLVHWRESSPVYLKNTSSGAFASQFVEDVEAMEGYFSRYWPQQALAIISPLLILCVIAYFNWLCALLLLIAAPLIPLFMVLVGMGAEQLNQKYSTMRQRLAGHFLDRVANLSTIKFLGARASVFAEVADNSNQYRHIVMKTLKVAFLSSAVLEFFTSVAIAALAIYIGFSLYGAITWGPADSITLFSGLTILILAPEFFQPLRKLSQYYHDRASALGAANNLIESLVVKDKSTHVQSIEGSYVNNQQAASVDLNLTGLCVGYDKPLIQNLNLALTSGSIFVVSGGSGSGKTTLLNTLAGFVPALGGAFSVHPQPDNSIAYLPQKPWIKNGTVYENLLALAPNATKADMYKVLKKLGLEDELGLKHLGVDTRIDEHRQGLSGGQLQRIAFARVMLNPTPIILFDEPTAQLDVLSKAYIVDALNILKQGRILVIASHDPLLINMSDVHINLNAQRLSI